MKYIKNILNEFKKRATKVDKRIRFVSSALILTSLLLVSTFFLFDKAPFFIILFVISGYILTSLSILEGIDKIEWLMLFLMPIALTVAFYLFYFLFPVRWLTRLPFIIIYGISIYAVLLCSNIFNVGVEKSLQLYRAAFSVNFFFQLLVAFLFFNTILSFKLNFLVNSLIVAVLSFLLAIHLIWTLKLDLKLERYIFLFAFFIALLLGELTSVLSFIPLKPIIFSLFLSATYYSLAGLIYNYVDQRLFKETIREFVTVWVVVLVIVFLSISW